MCALSLKLISEFFFAGPDAILLKIKRWVVAEPWQTNCVESELDGKTVTKPPPPPAPPAAQERNTVDHVVNSGVHCFVLQAAFLIE